MLNRNAQIIQEHLASDEAEAHGRRLAEARRLAMDADDRRTKKAASIVFAVPFVLVALAGLAWVISHVFVAAVHALGVVFALAYVVATIWIALWSGGFFSAARTVKHSILKALGRDKPSLVSLSPAKGRAAVISSAMWYFGFAIAPHLSKGAASMTMTLGSFVISTVLIIGSVNAWLKYGTERRLASAGYSSEVDAIYADLKRDEGAAFSDDVNAHLANMDAPEPASVAAVEDTSPLPAVNWNDDNPLKDL